MEVPVRNLVETVDLTEDDILLPMLECIVNSIISLEKSQLPKEKRKIQVQIFRGSFPNVSKLERIKIIDGYKVIDNGIGFNTKNYQSFNTPFSQVNKDYGCKGIGRFTVLAAYNDFLIESNYKENETWYRRDFRFSIDNEIEPLSRNISGNKEWETVITVKNCTNPLLAEKSALSLFAIGESIMIHCLIYYLNDSLPRIEVIDSEENDIIIINDLFEKVSKEKEREFLLKGEKFKLYIIKTLKEGSRKNNYIHYCANNRSVGYPRNMKNINSIFLHPILQNGNYYFFDIYIVSNFLNEKVFRTRNAFNIPKEPENTLFNDKKDITFQDIEQQISIILEQEYDDVIKKSKEKNSEYIKNYISQKAPRFKSLLRNIDVINSIPPNLNEDKLEEELYRISFNIRKKVENNIDKFIETKKIDEKAINDIINDFKAKTAYDADNLADYMMRRKAVLRLFEKFLDADETGKYRLEEDIHNLIFPMGLTNEDIDYENHNLWILDERFISYKFIASDKSISSFSQVKSRKEPDLTLIDNNSLFNNPISFGDKSSGEINSMVIFEFKRPGEVAHQKNKKDYRWEFSELIEPYFEEFIYQPSKRNYKGNQVILSERTPKFGYVIVDIIPKDLVRYNRNKGWKETPFGTYFKIESELNLHLEVMTFRKLLELSKQRHNPFFNKLFI